MNLKFKDTGDKRWVCQVSIEHHRIKEFRDWLEENLQGRYMLSYLYQMSDDDVVEFGYELRGGDVKDKMLVALRWQ